MDTLEPDAGFRTISRDGRPVSQAFLSDRLENGAGYCRELARPEQFSDLLTTRAGDILATWIDASEEIGRAAPHGPECDTSCNRCLRDFANLPYHGLLDWRLALDMAWLARSADATIDLETAWDGMESPWRRLVTGPRAPVSAILEHLRYGPSETFAGLTGFVRTNGDGRLLIMRHPLWQADHPAWVEVVAEARERYPGPGEPLAADPFCLQRRPGDFA